MSYQPLALKYRPRRFSEVVGQEAVGETLKNAILQERVAHAFLFMGSRGVGKTSMARILAKAINCPETQNGEPCASCEICESIARGEDLDVIEIDGASNRGIDEIRAIRENVGYAPSRGRAKIYIIDEVHMLTIQAFNALLKTLEEPPEHVHFIFATTEAQAVPETILSRCQRFEFHRITTEAMLAHLQSLCEKEGVSADAGVLEEVVEKGEGGLRDALSLLDQLIAFSGERLGLEHLDAVLGTIDGEHLGRILEAVGEGDEAKLLDALDGVFEAGRDAEDLLSQIVDLLREAMVREARGLPGGGEGRRAQLVADARKHFGMDRILFALRLCLNTRREMKLAGLPRLQLELCFLKLCRSKDLVPLQELVARLEAGGLGGGAPAGAAPAPAARGGAQPPRSQEAPPPAAAAPPGAPRKRWQAPPSGRAGAPSAPPPSAPAPAAAPTRGPAPARGPAPTRGPAPAEAQGAPHRGVPAPRTIEEVRDRWGAFLGRLREESTRASAFLEAARPARLQGSVLTVLFPQGQGFALSQLKGTLGGAVKRVVPQMLGAGLELDYGLAGSVEEMGPRKSVYEDKSVRKIIDHFDGGVVGVEDEENQR